MPYVRPRERDSIPIAVPLLLATGSLGLLALVWRRIAAPRAERRIAQSHSAVVAPEPARQVEVIADDAQPLQSGVGPLFHRQYEILLAGTSLEADAVLRLMQRHMAELAPSSLAHFEKTTGSDGLARVGDEYEITMLGPWNGRVRVVSSSARRFTLETLEGHPEAGHITFSVSPFGDYETTLRVHIESWARARNALVSAAYGTIGLGRQMQTEVWITFLQRLSTLAGVEETPEVRITTETHADDAVAPLPDVNA
jgi:hypothetical protein